jgi:hypothetical protein
MARRRVVHFTLQTMSPKATMTQDVVASFDLSSWNDVLHPRRQNRTEFLAHAVASIVSSYDSQMIEHLGVKELLLTTAFTGDDENRSPQLSLLHDPTLASNALDSFLAGDLSIGVGPLHRS